MCQPVCTTTHTRWSSGSLASSGLLSLEFPAAIMQQIVLDVYKTGQEINFLGIFALEERMERRERLKSLSFMHLSGGGAVLPLGHTAAAPHAQPQSLVTPTAARAQSKGLYITGTWEWF